MLKKEKRKRIIHRQFLQMDEYLIAYFRVLVFQINIYILHFQKISHNCSYVTSKIQITCVNNLSNL